MDWNTKCKIVLFNFTTDSNFTINIYIFNTFVYENVVIKLREGWNTMLLSENRLSQ